MYSDDDIDQAVAAGAFPAEAAAALRRYVASRRETPTPDEEHFRLITGFNDVFVVVAGALLLLAVNWLGRAAAEWFGPVLVAIVSWVLAEFFVRKRRMALPAIMLLLTFVAGCFSAVSHALGPATSAIAIGSVAGAIAAGVHWRRFHVPITVAAAVGALAIGSVLGLVSTQHPLSSGPVLVVIFVWGLVAFAMALRFDASDRERRTRRADVGFWLHLLAAPLLVHPMFQALGIFEGRVDARRVLAVLVIYVLIAVISLWIDRRALMVSALGYVLYALAKLFDGLSAMAVSPFAVTALIVGTALLFLSAFWQPSRAAAVRWMPRELHRFVPPA
jgi:hypothetical protein